MRKVLLAVLLFQAANAFGQTVSAEIESGPLSSTNLNSFLPAPAVAAAKDRTGVAIAWLMHEPKGDRISVVRLDGTGHVTGAVQTIPASSDVLDVLTPSIAAIPGSEGFTLAWLETAATAPSVVRAAYCRIDRDLKPSTPVVLAIIPSAATGPAIVRSGKTTWISAAASVWELRDDGSLGAPLNAGMAATDMAVATDFPQIVASNRIRSSTYTCNKEPGCHFSGGGFGSPLDLFCNDACRAYEYSYQLEFSALSGVSASKSFAFDSDAAPAVDSDGRDEAIVWLQGTHATGGQVVMSRLLPSAFAAFPVAASDFRVIGNFGPDAGATRAGIAGDGERYVVVWRTGTPDGAHDIVGASIDRTGNIIPLSIATSTADERDPSVISVGHGTFLVAYEKIGDGQRRIANRFVTFGSRARAVR